MPNSLTTTQPLGQGFTLATNNAGPVQVLVDVGGAAGVTSVFGRTGAVVSQNGDYDSGQVTNTSGVAGATVTAALNTLAAGIVLALALVSNTAQGQAPQTNGIAGQALLSTALGSTWSTNFQAQTLTTTGSLVLNNAASFVRLGLVAGSGAGSAAATGDVRIRNNTGGSGTGWFLMGRNGADSADLVVLSYGTFGSNAVQLGGAGVATTTLLGNTVAITGAGTFLMGMLVGMRLSGPQITYDDVVVAPAITQAQSTTAAGQPFSFTSQGSTVGAGGDLTIGTGAGSTGITSGVLRLATGVTTVLTFNATGTLADFGAINVTTSGVLSVGTAPYSSTGNFRVPHGFTWAGRNQANSADRTIVSWGIAANNAIVLGDTAASTPNLLLSVTTGFDLRFATTPLVRFGAAVMNFQQSAAADFDVQLTGSAMIGLDGAGTVRNIALFAAASTSFQTGDRVLFLTDRTVAPTGNPTGGGYHWSETGGLPAFRTVAGGILILNCSTAATATAGGGALPATPSTFMNINLGGTALKIPCYLP